MAGNKRPLILALVADLYFSVRIENTAAALGYDASILTGKNIDWPSAGGQESALTLDKFMKILRSNQPDLVIIDLHNPYIDWQNWILHLRETIETQDYPVITFGSHVDVDRFRRAREAGATEVLARSRFVSGLPALLKRYLRQEN